jgi:hypothetical protein
MTVRRLPINGSTARSRAVDQLSISGDTLMMGRLRLLRRGISGLLAVMALGAMASTASADGVELGLDGCPARATTQPFARWSDVANYTLVPGSTFEGALTGWKLTGGAKVVSGSESFAASGAAGKLALSLPSGSSATTPPMCAAVLDPTLRYFASNDGGALSLLSVQILYYPSTGGTVTLPLGVNAGGKSWAPSLPTIVGANLLGVLQGGQVQVAFRFAPVGLGASWRIDDVYLDPRASH